MIIAIKRYRIYTFVTNVVTKNTLNFKRYIFTSANVEIPFKFTFSNSFSIKDLSFLVEMGKYIFASAYKLFQDYNLLSAVKIR